MAYRTPSEEFRDFPTRIATPNRSRAAKFATMCSLATFHMTSTVGLRDRNSHISRLEDCKRTPH